MSDQPTTYANASKDASDGTKDPFGGIASQRPQPLTERVCDRVLQFDYGVVLPMCAALPLSLGRTLAGLRGLINAAFDLDWRSLALRRRYVRGSTYRAMRQLRPGASPGVHAVRRFIHYSREEWEANLFRRERHMRALSAASTVEGLAPLQQMTNSGQGLVLLTMHFDSFCLGIVLLGLQGLKVHVMTSAIVEDPRLHPVVRRFFERKYRGMERYLNGGRMVHVERRPRYFYEALERGEVVVVLADLPPVRPGMHSAIVPFGGRRRRLTTGALRIAEKTGSAIGAFLCTHTSGNRYRVQCTAPFEADSDSLMQLYAWFDRHLREMPDRWWAADLLGAMPEVEPDG